MTQSRELEGKGAQRARRRKGAAIGRECESVTAARRVNPSSKQTLPLAPRNATGNPVRRMPDADQGNPVYDTGAWVHKSYGLYAELWVRKRRTAARSQKANRRPR
jgi:hypothetical protein